ncbi:MAG: hypothetical protein OEY01_03765 [Desulfobulbaceae bacterium]|nr:hypothetical protein [Desulfobulbaceae bacterium]
MQRLTFQVHNRPKGFTDTYSPVKGGWVACPAFIPDKCILRNPETQEVALITMSGLKILKDINADSKALHLAVMIRMSEDPELGL